MKVRTLTALLTGIVLLNACKSKPYELGRKSSADTVAIADTTAAIKLVKTAEIQFKVKNVQQTSDSILALATKFNGMVTHHQITSSANDTHDVRLSNDSVMRVSAFNTTADMTVKIPSEKIESFLNNVSKLSLYVNVRRMDVEDRSLDYLSSQLKLNSRNQLVNQQKQGKITIKDPSAVLNLKDDLVDEQINNRKINDEVKYSVISLNFYQSNTISKEVVANDDPSTYKLPYFSRFGMAFSNGWYLFKELVILLADMWIFIIVGAGMWILARYYKRKERVS
ncbi:MAG: DUF4349 domain-containing protein [Sphingobacteriales bacterium]